MAGKRQSQGKSPLKQGSLLGFITRSAKPSAKSSEATPSKTPPPLGAEAVKRELPAGKKTKTQQQLLQTQPSEAGQQAEPHPSKKAKKITEARGASDDGSDGDDSAMTTPASVCDTASQEAEASSTTAAKAEAKTEAPSSQQKASPVTKRTDQAAQESEEPDQTEKDEDKEEEEEEEEEEEQVMYTSRGRRVRRVVKYFDSDDESASSDDEEQEAVRRALRTRRKGGAQQQQKQQKQQKLKKNQTKGGGKGRRRVARMVNSDDDDDSESDEYVPDDADEAIMDEDDDDEQEMMQTARVIQEDEEPAVEEPESDILNEDDEEEDVPTPRKKRSKRTPSKASSSPSRSNSSSGGGGGGGGGLTSASGLSFGSIPTAGKKQGSSNGSPERYAWLARPRDKNKRTEGHPEFDPTSLYIPPSGWAKMTPFEKQYWDIKQHHWNTILFFKKGKFYELYERDAEIGNREFQLKMTDRVNMCMAGVPEITFPDWAARFLAKGYKVARVDERENAIAKKMRETKTGKKGPKIIERKLSAVYTQGTLMGDFVIGDMSNFIMAIKEDEDTRTYGVCFADTATAEFNVCHFVDDAARTAFETLIVQVMPKELVLPKKSLSKVRVRCLSERPCLVGGEGRGTKGGRRFAFWSSQMTIDNLEKGTRARASVDACSPERLRAFLSKDEAMSALGGLVSYFKTLLLDKSLLSQGTFFSYDPLHHGATLVIDGQTLQNLDVLCNMQDGTTSGSLLELLCQCHTAFGKRMFRRWLCHPLRRVNDITERQNAVVDLTEHVDLRDALSSMLKPLPDLERLLSRVHVGNCKLSDLISLLDAFDAVSGQDEGCVGSLFPNLKAELKAIANIFDRQEAKATDKLTPKPGALPEYDVAVDQMQSIEKRLNEHLANVRREFGAGKAISFWQPSAGRERYQIQVRVAMKKVPSSWKLMSSTKANKRYHSPEAVRLVAKWLEAEETISQFLKTFFSRVLNSINEHREKFGAAVSALSQLDCLLSLYRAKDSMGSPMCRPVFVSTSGDKASRAVLDLREMRHPTLQHSSSITDYIPNDTHLGGEEATTMVLTGPNMGGKSTLLRQTCIAVIMAQLGCWVPAESFTLTPVDRIFTRIGANDNIVAGRSTFMVELKETATILNKATSSSLVILDELGRGTSTFDGYAIAFAVLSHITDAIRCRCMFATHYHLLTDELKTNPNVTNYNMACVVDDHQKDVTFLYKLQPGVCSKSYGMNVAHMAGVMDSIVETAKEKAVQYEATSRFGKLQDRKAKQLALLRFVETVTALTSDDGDNGDQQPRPQERVERFKEAVATLKPILDKLQRASPATPTQTDPMQ
ncbi:hypothetical protein PTSG_04067 [Salpingoeca rosetta]|uniref:DNA mismatch repair protein n=1 Tax=Salpingoeca rosetta (strain ATCC 50818 / BSB-021) TaxID=946362 RepID=F2U7P3_SALR5|nr:uncharacterized protein PTSG_04067 [Salpingoeca rosetta]EGD83460.1 hypothetical protein PTSG_04067 [Salpingoeca rosetta]|eukprot:XP_004994964.1 hypothetical protein PTSG_04067 [Salpingoeca rosetta]